MRAHSPEKPTRRAPDRGVRRQPGRVRRAPHTPTLHYHQSRALNLTGGKVAASWKTNLTHLNLRALHLLSFKCSLRCSYPPTPAITSQASPPDELTSPSLCSGISRNQIWYWSDVHY
ncbi:hypothetical protein E2C01_095430 [Portunus trituberculatus]|uniref:Uncharacterized protein n=1 Tax=Portunus trituberculatus TaxID=210409 RepID=A0A5B7K047_PORTR|nr:hypothetical protein [Portunus trituberculatus]